jgi:predicted RecA/RadA family phage recombinase
MTSKFVQPGEVIDYTAGANITSGQVVLMGVRIGVALAAIANGSTGSVQVTGVFTIAKLATDVVAQGAALYWDNTNSRLTTTASGNTLAGYATAAAGSGVSTVNIKINA